MAQKNKTISLGIDIGGTKVRIAMVRDGNIFFSRRYPTNTQKSFDAIIADIAGHVKDCIRSSAKGLKPSAVGVGVAGQVEPDTGTVSFAPNLGWENVPLKDELEKSIGLPVMVTNDVRAATYGEWLLGAGQGESNIVGIFVGTGIGGGVVSKGRILEGCSNTAGEIGHITVQVGGRQCRCLNLGCLEAYAGGWAIAERAREAVKDDLPAGHRLLKLSGAIENITAATVTKAYKEKDPLASYLVEETGKYLGAGVGSIVNILNPCKVILGGGVIEKLPVLVSMVRQNIRKHSLEAANKMLKIVRAELGNNAAAAGAAVLAGEAQA